MRKTLMLMVILIMACAHAGQAFAAADGAAVYKKCSGCHKATGLGTPGLFPPLDRHAAELASADRNFPIQAVLFGLKGEIRIGKQTYYGTMPAYADLLGDDEIAAVLNYILSRWGNEKILPKDFGKITPAEVKAQRERKLSSEQVYEARRKLKL